MDRCPSELWTRIFGLACTDGGRTGCAIARTSRYFREAVIPVQLHSVALCGTNKMAVFADILEQREPAHRRVRHLFLSGRVTQAIRYKEVSSILFRILSIVAPDLLTLTSTMRQKSTAELDTLSFPRLTELTLSGYCFHFDTPCLWYLHILSANGGTLYHTSRAAALTHLRLSAVNTIQALVQHQLERYLAGFEFVPLDEGYDTREYSHPFPSTLQSVIIHIDHNYWMNPQFLALLLADKGEKLKIETDVCARDTRDDWEDRITGGYGCWSERGI